MTLDEQAVHTWAESLGLREPVYSMHPLLPGTLFFHPNQGGVMMVRHTHVIEEKWDHDIKQAVAKHLDTFHKDHMP